MKKIVRGPAETVGSFDLKINHGSGYVFIMIKNGHSFLNFPHTCLRDLEYMLERCRAYCEDEGYKI